MGLSYSKYKEMNEQGMFTFDTEKISNTGKDVADFLNGISGQLNGSAKPWSKDEINKNSASIDGLRNRLRYMDMYAKSIQSSDADTYNRLTSLSKELRDKLNEAQKTFDSGLFNNSSPQTSGSQGSESVTKTDEFNRNLLNLSSGKNAVEKPLKQMAEYDTKAQKAAAEVRYTQTTPDKAAEKYGVNKNDIKKKYGEIRAYERYSDYEKKYSKMSLDDINNVLYNPENRAEEVVDAVNKNVGERGREISAREIRTGLSEDNALIMDEAYKDVAHKLNMNEKEVKRVYNDYLKAQDESTTTGYKSRALRADEKTYLLGQLQKRYSESYDDMTATQLAAVLERDRLGVDSQGNKTDRKLNRVEKSYIIQKLTDNGGADELESLKKRSMGDRYYDEVKNAIDKVMEAKKEDKHYLDFIKKHPEAEEWYKKIKALENPDPRNSEKKGMSGTLTGNDSYTEYEKKKKSGAQKAYSEIQRFNSDYGDNAYENFDKYKKRYQEHQAALKNNEWWKQYAKEQPVWASLASSPINMFGSLVDAARYVGSTLNKWQGGDGYIDPETTNNKTAETIRDTVAQMIDKNTKDMGDWNYWAKTFYSTAMSTSDMLGAAAINAIPYVGQAASAAMFFSSAGVSSANKVIENGGSIEQATGTMIAHGAAELIFEKFSLDKLITISSNVKSAKELAKNIVKQMGIEGSEEVATSLSNAITDRLINGDLSEIQLSIDNYKKQGMNDVEARNKAYHDFFVDQVALGDFVGGALAGGALGAAAGGKSYAGYKLDSASVNKQNSATYTDAVKQMKESDPEYFKNIPQAIDEVKNSGNAKAKRLAEAIEREVKNKGGDYSTVKDSDYANLLTLMANNEYAKVRDAAIEGDTAALGKYKGSETLKQVGMQQTASSIKNDLSRVKTVTVTDQNGNTREIQDTPFGKTHPNGMSATDRSGKNIVVKSIEVSAPEAGKAENTIVLRTQDGKMVDADDITPHGNFAPLLDRAKTYNTWGAKVFMAMYDDYVEHAREQGTKENINEYDTEYQTLYDLGKQGVKWDNIKNNRHYAQTIESLGYNAATAAIAAGNRDGDVRLIHEKNRAANVRVTGKTIAESRVRAAADEQGNTIDVSNVNQDMIDALNDVAKTFGRDIVLDEIDDGLGFFNKEDGTIHISKNADNDYMLSLALHEAVHGINQTSPAEFATLRDFVLNYYAAKGVNIDYLRDNTETIWGDDAKNDDVLYEEIICRAVMAIPSDSEAMRIALGVEKNPTIRQKLANIIEKLANRIKDFIAKRSNVPAKVLLDDVEMLREFAKKLRQAADADIKTRTAAQTQQNEKSAAPTQQKNNTTGESGVVYAKDDTDNKSSDRFTDTDYLTAVERGDMETAQRMVDEAARAAGYGVKAYHQTAADFTVFDTESKGAGRYDDETPNGIFLKPTDTDIGLKGKKQMALYASIKNPLTVHNREELVKFYEENIDGYEEKKAALKHIDIEYGAKYEEASKRADEEYAVMHRKLRKKEITREEYDNFAKKEGEEARVIKEWEQAGNKASAELKALVTRYFKNSEYDGIIIEQDAGSFGRSTKTFIALEQTQVKSADPVTYDDNGKVIPLSERFKTDNADIRYAKDDTALSDGSDILYAMDDTLTDDLFDLGEEFWADENKSVLERTLKNDPRYVATSAVNSMVKTAGKVFKAGSGITLDKRHWERIAKRIMRKYEIRQRNESTATEKITETVRSFAEGVQNAGAGDINGEVETLVSECRQYVEMSGDYRFDNEYIEGAYKSLRASMQGKLVVIDDDHYSDVIDNYGSLKNYARALGVFRVVKAENTNSRNAVTPEGILESFYQEYPELGPRGYVGEYIEDNDSYEAITYLDKLLNVKLAKKWISPYDSNSQYYIGVSAEQAAVEMALDVISDLVEEQSREIVTVKNAQKAQIKEIAKGREELLKQKAARETARKNNYKQQLEDLGKTSYQEKLAKIRKSKRKLKDKIALLDDESRNQKIIIDENYRSYREEYQERQKRNNAFAQLGKMYKRMAKKVDGKANKNEYIPESLKKPIMNVLSLFRVEPGQYKNGNERPMPGVWRTLEAAPKLSDKIDELYRAYEKLKPKVQAEVEDKKNKNWLAYDVNALAYDERIQEALAWLSEQVRGKNIYQMNSSQLATVLEGMKALEFQLNRSVEMIVDGWKTTIQEATDQGIDEINHVHFFKNGKNILTDGVRSLRNSFVATSLDPVRYARMLSGYHDGAVIYKLVSAIHGGDQKRVKIMQRSYNPVQDVISNYQRSELVALQRREVKEFTKIDIKTGAEVKLSAGMLLSVYLTDRQKDGHRHLTNEIYEHYTRVADLDLLNKNRVLPDLKRNAERARDEDSHEIRFSKDELLKIKEYVEGTPLLRDLAQAIHSVLNGYLADEINKVSMEKYGKMIATVQNYYPIKVDSKDPNKQFDDIFEGENIFNDYRLKSRGFTKQRTESYTAIVIEDALDVFQRHVKKAAEYCGFLIPLENFKKVWNSDNGDMLFSTAVEQKFGRSATHYFNKLLGDIQERKNNIDDNLLTKATGSAMGSALAVNPRSALKNYAALPLANKYFGAANVSKAVLATKAGMGKTGKDLVAKYNEYTPYMWFREQGNGTVVGETSRQHGLYGRAGEKFDLMGKADRAVVNLLLYAAEQHVKQSTELEVDSKEFMQEVARQFEKCVDESQPNSMLTSKPQFVRSNVMRTLSLNVFASQRMAMGNGLMDSFMEYAARKHEYKGNKTAESKLAMKNAKKQFVRTSLGVLEATALSSGLGVLASVLLYHKWDDLKDEEGNITFGSTVTGLLKMWTRGIPEEIAGCFAFVDKIYSVAEKMIDKEAYGADFSVMSLEAVNNFISYIQKSIKFENGIKIDMYSLAKAYATLADMLGIPLFGGMNEQRLLQSFYSYGVDIYGGQLGFADNKGNIDLTYMDSQIAEAINSDDMKRADWLRSLWETELESKGQSTSKISDKIALALVKSNDEIYQATIARENGNMAPYIAMTDKLTDLGVDGEIINKLSGKMKLSVKAELNDGGFTDEDDVTAELMQKGFKESAAAKLAKELIGNSDKSNQDTKPEYTLSDAFSALRSGDTSSYEAIREYFMESKGKTADEVDKSMRSASRTDKVIEQYIQAFDDNDTALYKRLRGELENIFGGSQGATEAIQKYREKQKKKSNSK